MSAGMFWIQFGKMLSEGFSDGYSAYDVIHKLNNHYMLEPPWLVVVALANIP